MGTIARAERTKVKCMAWRSLYLESVPSLSALGSNLGGNKKLQTSGALPHYGRHGATGAEYLIDPQICNVDQRDTGRRSANTSPAQ